MRQLQGTKVSQYQTLRLYVRNVIALWHEKKVFTKQIQCFAKLRQFYVAFLRCYFCIFNFTR